jgi:hypothetical protein
MISDYTLFHKQPSTSDIFTLIVHILDALVRF